MSSHRHYLFDVGRELKQLAIEAAGERKAAPCDSADYAFKAGRSLAFYEVISILQQQAIGFGIPLSELQLDDINPDRDLA